MVNGQNDATQGPASVVNRCHSPSRTRQQTYAADLELTALEQVHLPFGGALGPFARGGLAAFEELLGDLAQERGRPHLAYLAAPQALVSVREDEAPAGARHADVEEPALFLALGRIRPPAPGQGQHTVLATHDEYDVELEPLGRVQRKQ